MIRALVLAFLVIAVHAEDGEPIGMPFFNAIGDHKDLAPTQRVVAMLSEPTATLSDPAGGIQFVKERLPLLFASQVHQARARQADNPFRDTFYRKFGFYLDQENLDHVEKLLSETFSEAKPMLPKDKIKAVIARMEKPEKCLGYVIGFYNPDQEKRATLAIVLIFSSQGRILLIDEI